MIVCAHGNVADFCKEHGMDIHETWNGDISDYSGSCRVLVTDSDIPEMEYYFVKSELMAKGVELVSTRYQDNEFLTRYLMYANERRREKYNSHLPFGLCHRNGEVIENAGKMVAVRRILELRDAGVTLRDIREDEFVRRPDGKKLSISTIQKIIKNRKIYKL